MAPGGERKTPELQRGNIQISPIDAASPRRIQTAKRHPFLAYPVAITVSNIICL